MSRKCQWGAVDVWHLHWMCPLPRRTWSTIQMTDDRRNDRTIESLNYHCDDSLHVVDWLGPDWCRRVSRRIATRRSRAKLRHDDAISTILDSRLSRSRSRSVLISYHRDDKFHQREPLVRQHQTLLAIFNSTGHSYVATCEPVRPPVSGHHVAYRHRAITAYSLRWLHFPHSTVHWRPAVSGNRRVYSRPGRSLPSVPRGSLTYRGMTRHYYTAPLRELMSKRIDGYTETVGAERQRRRQVGG